MSFFDEFLAKHVADEADRAAINKYPSFRTSVEELATREADNQKWLKENYDFEARKTHREQDLERALVEANERLANNAGGTDMGFDEILAGLKAKGYVDTETLNAKLTAVSAETDKKFGHLDAGVMKFWKETVNLPIEHEKEFGAPLDAEGFAAQYLNNPAAGARQAYDSFVAGRRAEKANKDREALEAKHKQEIEEARKAAAAEARQQALIEAAQNGGGGIPSDQGRGSGQMGWMQRKAIESRTKTDDQGNQMVPSGNLGDGTTANAIMTQLAKDRAEGKVPTFVQ